MLMIMNMHSLYVSCSNYTGTMVYAEIQSVYVIDDQKFFFGHLMEILENFDHMRSLCVSQTNTKVLLTYSDMFCHGVIHLKSGHGKFYLIEKDRMYL